MPSASDVMYIAFLEALVKTGWKTNKARVFEYLRTSRQTAYVADNVNDPGNSWCGDFVYWCLAQAGVRPLPANFSLTGSSNHKSNAIERYKVAYTQVTDPQPGDIYNMPVNASGVGKNHVGFIVNADNPGAIRTIDGNTDGGLGGDINLLVKGLGGGYVAYNSRQPSKTPLYYFRPPYDSE